MAVYKFIEDMDSKSVCVVDAETGRLLARLLLLRDMRDGVTLDIAIRETGNCRHSPMLAVQTSIHDHHDDIVSSSYTYQDWEDAVDSTYRHFAAEIRECYTANLYPGFRSWDDIVEGVEWCMEQDDVAIDYPEVDGRDVIKENLLASLHRDAERVLSLITANRLPKADDDERECIQEWLDHFWDEEEVAHDA